MPRSAWPHPGRGRSLGRTGSVSRRARCVRRWCTPIGQRGLRRAIRSAKPCAAPSRPGWLKPVRRAGRPCWTPTSLIRCRRRDSDTGWGFPVAVGYLIFGSSIGRRSDPDARPALFPGGGYSSESATYPVPLLINPMSGRRVPSECQRSGSSLCGYCSWWYTFDG